MTVDELVALVDKVTYKPLSRVQVFPGLGQLRVSFYVADTGGGDQRIHISLSWDLPAIDGWDEVDALAWILERVDEAEEHETREWFRVDGVAVFDPHSA